MSPPARIDNSAHRRTGDRGWLRVDIASRGIGIPTANQPHVFTSSHRAADHRTTYTGTGLGLAICHRHGGTIGVTDNPDGGTRTWFALPTSTTPEPAALAAHQAPPTTDHAEAEGSRETAAP